MGRWYYNRKATAEESCDLTIYQIRKWGMLSGHHYTTVTWTSRLSGKSSIEVIVDVRDEPYARFIYTTTDSEGNKTNYDYKVNLVTTACNFGGVRYWFGCPSCGRRVGALYLAPGNVRFRCRRCNNLSYNSRNESSAVALLGETCREIDKLRSQIKRWTWRGRPTRKARKLYALQRKAGILDRQAMTQFERFKARLR